jgi:hypothetical protein
MRSWRMINVGGRVYLLYVVCTKLSPPLFHSFQSPSQPCRFLEEQFILQIRFVPLLGLVVEVVGLSNERSVLFSETADADDFHCSLAGVYGVLGEYPIYGV